jgi:hypothetical protein
MTGVSKVYVEPMSLPDAAYARIQMVHDSRDICTVSTGDTSFLQAAAKATDFPLHRKSNPISKDVLLQNPLTHSLPKIVRTQMARKTMYQRCQLVSAFWATSQHKSAAELLQHAHNICLTVLSVHSSS